MTLKAKVSWPNDAKIAISPLFLLESWPDDLGTAKSLNRGADRPVPENAQFKKDIAVIRDRWFGETVGVGRILDILNKFSVKSSFFINGRIADRNPQLTKLIHDNGHEIGIESYDHTYSFMKTLQEEQKDIRKSLEVVQKVLGEKPRGYLSPGLKPTFNTPSILLNEGLQYWVDLDDDELPYWLKTQNGRILVIPNMRYLNDYSTFSESARVPEDLFRIWKDTFDYLYEESAGEEGRLMLWDNHLFITGRPNRSIYLVKFLKYIREFKGVWITRADEIAAWWKSNYSGTLERTWNDSFIVPP